VNRENREQAAARTLAPGGPEHGQKANQLPGYRN
jgi:hypothetical protein